MILLRYVCSSIISVKPTHELGVIESPFVHLRKVQVVHFVLLRNHPILQNQSPPVAAQSSLQDFSAHLASPDLSAIVSTRAE